MSDLPKYRRGDRLGNAEQSFRSMLIVSVKSHAPRIIPRRECESVGEIQCSETDRTDMVPLVEGESSKARINRHDVRDTQGLGHRTGNLDDVSLLVTQGVFDGHLARAYIRRHVYLREHGESRRHAIGREGEDIGTGAKNIPHTGTVHGGEIGELHDNRRAFRNLTHMSGHHSAFFDALVGGGGHVDRFEILAFAAVLHQLRGGKHEDGVVRNNFSPVVQKFTNGGGLVVIEKERYILACELAGFGERVAGGGESGMSSDSAHHTPSSL